MDSSGGSSESRTTGQPSAPASASAMQAATAGGGQGLVRIRNTPASLTAAIVDSTDACPVRMIRPTSGNRALTAVRKSAPPIPGIRSSDTTTWIGCESSRASPASAELAVMIV